MKQNVHLKRSIVFRMPWQYWDSSLDDWSYVEDHIIEKFNSRFLLDKSHDNRPKSRLIKKYDFQLPTLSVFNIESRFIRQKNQSNTQSQLQPKSYQRPNYFETKNWFRKCSLIPLNNKQY